MSKMRLRVPRVGEAAPDFALPAVGGSVRLGEHPKPVAIVFFRHLA